MKMWNLQEWSFKEQIFICLMVLIIKPDCVQGEAVTFVPEPTLADVQVLVGRQFNMKTDSKSACSVECYMDPSCTSFGYVGTGSSCQGYSIDVAEFTKNVVSQSGTQFYKAVCTQAGYTYVRSLSLCVKRYTTPASWPDANTTCTNDGSYLIDVTSIARQQYLKDSLLSIDLAVDYWTGGVNQSPGGLDWVWTSGVGLSASDETWIMWLENHPTNANTDVCLALVEHLGDVSFASEECSQIKPYICAI